MGSRATQGPLTLSRIAVVLLLLPWAAAAQIVCALGPGVAAYKSDSDQRPSPDALELAGRLNAAVKTLCGANCPTVALFRNATAANMMLIASSGQAKLVYAPQFLTSVYDSNGDGAVLAVVAHELGHALDDTMGAAWIQTTWSPELRADAWGACTLARAGLSPADLEAALRTLAKYPSPAHPPWSQRLPALRTGYTQCGGTASAFDSAAKTQK